VFEPTADEPLLTACASFAMRERRPATAITPGVLDAAAMVDSMRLSHVVALDEAVCRLTEVTNEPGVSTPSSWLSAPVVGLAGAEVRVDPASIDATVRSFSSARLRLEWLDCGLCALSNLESFLASGSGQGCDEDARIDPLAAICVDPRCETLAADLGDLLAVPTGLALAHFGLVTDAPS